MARVMSELSGFKESWMAEVCDWIMTSKEFRYVDARLA
jgi:hypothetical protein